MEDHSEVVEEPLNLCNSNRGDKEDENQFNVCRICYCSSEDEELIAPCQCAGSVKYLHESCLKTWLKSGATHCEICNVPYKFKKIVNSYFERKVPCITSWHLAWIIKEIFVLDWFHLLETVFICISLGLINRMSSYDILYQYALIGVVEVLYYGLNVISCLFLLYYERWTSLNVIIHIVNYHEDTANTPETGIFIKCFDKYAQLIKRNKRLKQVVEVIELNDAQMV